MTQDTSTVEAGDQQTAPLLDALMGVPIETFRRWRDGVLECIKAGHGEVVTEVKPAPDNGRRIFVRPAPSYEEVLKVEQSDN